jgi:hypothetical protein
MALVNPSMMAAAQDNRLALPLAAVQDNRPVVPLLQFAGGDELALWGIKINEFLT